MNRQIYELDSKTIANSDAIPLQDSVGASEAKKVTVQNIIDAVPSDPTKADKALQVVSLNVGATIDDTESNKAIECDGTFTVTIDNAVSEGFQVIITNVGTGVITIAGNIMHSKDGNLNLSSQWAGATVYKRAGVVEFVVFGDLTA